jgi:hypothetical protein
MTSDFLRYRAVETATPGTLSVSIFKKTIIRKLGKKMKTTAQVLLELTLSFR